MQPKTVLAHSLVASMLALAACSGSDVDPTATDPTTPDPTTPGPIDADGDGILSEDDCDDTDPLVGGDEVPYDGLDNDCDPLTLDDDLDEDGVPLVDDCDDDDPAVHRDDPWTGPLSEADVAGFDCDAFCGRTILGDVSIQKSPATDLQPLHCVTRIEGALTVSFNLDLTSLSGLERLEEVEGNVTFTFNPNLTTLDGLDALTTVGGYLFLNQNEGLTTTAGVETLESVSDDLTLLNSDVGSLEGFTGLTHVGGNLNIVGQDMLADLQGLDALTSLDGQLLVAQNDTMTSLDGLEGLTATAGVVIADNPALLLLDGLQFIADIDGPLEVSGNVSLRNVTALYGLNEVTGDVLFEDNTGLSDASAQAVVDDIKTLGGTATVRNNDAP
ncbi:MAG: hypothetical protein KTR31_12000 [Myxococcales bacterium]|nr:hypothetical protein [Myxococcales bacterium]